jgi:aspartate ammonia-lyase
MDTNGTSISYYVYQCYLPSHRRFCTSNLGGTAIGTGIAADPHFSQVAVQAPKETIGKTPVD